jgi:endonuclease-3
MPKERKAPDEERHREILKRLKKEFPEARTALAFSNPLELLISTILSAQCTDVRVNMVTPALFAKYPTVKHFARAEQHELELDIKSTGFYHNKAKNIIGAAKTIVEKFGGTVPQTMEELLELPGVGRKTANCVLGGAFGIQSGIVVDTHVLRLSKRLGLTKEDNPEKVEQDLLTIVPKKDWYLFSNLLILHGRKTCNARKPLCGTCMLADICPSYIPMK